MNLLWRLEKIGGNGLINGLTYNSTYCTPLALQHPAVIFPCFFTEYANILSEILVGIQSLKKVGFLFEMAWRFKKCSTKEIGYIKTYFETRISSDIRMTLSYVVTSACPKWNCTIYNRLNPYKSSEIWEIWFWETMEVGFITSFITTVINLKKSGLWYLYSFWKFWTVISITIYIGVLIRILPVHFTIADMLTAPLMRRKTATVKFTDKLWLRLNTRLSNSNVLWR